MKKRVFTVIVLLLLSSSVIASSESLQSVTVSFPNNGRITTQTNTHAPVHAIWLSAGGNWNMDENGDGTLDNWVKDFVDYGYDNGFNTLIATLSRWKNKDENYLGWEIGGGAWEDPPLSGNLDMNYWTPMFDQLIEYTTQKGMDVLLWSWSSRMENYWAWTHENEDFTPLVRFYWKLFERYGSNPRVKGFEAFADTHIGFILGPSSSENEPELWQKPWVQRWQTMMEKFSGLFHSKFPDKIFYVAPLLDWTGDNLANDNWVKPSHPNDVTSVMFVMKNEHLSQEYPYGSKKLIDYRDWMRRHNASLMIQLLPEWRDTNGVFAPTYDWVKGLLPNLEADKIDWWWEDLYHRGIGSSNPHHVFDLNGNEREFMKAFRECLT